MVEGESSRGGGREEALQENKGGSKGEEKIRWRERGAVWDGDVLSRLENTNRD